MNAALQPYPVNARVRIGEQWGSIALGTNNAAGVSLSNPQYHVCYDDGKVEIVEHTDIAECYVDGMPYLIVLVDHETFARFAADEQAVTFQTVSAKKNRNVPTTTRGNVTLWRDHYWITTSGAWFEDGDSERCETDDAFILGYVSIELVVPRDEWRGEIRAPHFTHRRNTGYVVSATEGEFVCTGIVAHLAPMPQPIASATPNKLSEITSPQAQLAFDF